MPAFSVLEAVETHRGPLSAKELARILDVTPKTLYRGAATKAIPCYRVGGAIRFDPRAISFWLRKQHPSFAAASKSSMAAQP